MRHANYVKYDSQEIGVVAETGLAAIKAFQNEQGGLWDKFKAGGAEAFQGAGAGIADMR